MRHLKCVLTQLQGQIYLGSEPFIQYMRNLIDKKPTLIEVPKAQRKAEKSLIGFAKNYNKQETTGRVSQTGHYTMATIAN